MCAARAALLVEVVFCRVLRFVSCEVRVAAARLSRFAVWPCGVFLVSWWCLGAFRV